MKPLSFILAFSLSITFAEAQSNDSADLEKINYTILEFFDAYRAGDSARVAAIFTRKANIQTIQENKEGIIVISEVKPASILIDYIGKGLSEVHDERLWDTEIKSDGMLATVWTRYAFYLGKRFMHCGTETILLRKQDKEWKIFYLADTRQTENCNLPASVK